MSEQTFDPATPAPNKERPFLPRINDGASWAGLVKR